MTAAAGEPIIDNEPFEITAEKLLAAFLAADRLGRDIIKEEGAGAFKKLHR
jgi:hypothetical protein